MKFLRSYYEVSKKYRVFHTASWSIYYFCFLRLVLLLLLGVSGLLGYILLLLMLLEHHVLGVVELLLLLLLLLLELLLLLIGEMVVLARKVGLLLLLVWRTLGNLLHLTHFLIHLLTGDQRVVFTLILGALWCKNNMLGRSFMRGFFSFEISEGRQLLDSLLIC